MQYSEVELLQRIGQKDQSALSALYDRYHKILFSFAYRILLSREETEEVVADVFVGARLRLTTRKKPKWTLGCSCLPVAVPLTVCAASQKEKKNRK